MGSANRSALCEIEEAGDFFARPLAEQLDERYISATYLYRYFIEEGRLMYTGITNQPAQRHAAHMRGPWCKYAELVRYDFFPDRRLALIAETISIEDERPDFNTPVRLTSREWPVYLHWYRDKTGGKFVGERSEWFGLTGGYSIGEPRDEPEWWVPGFCNTPYDEWRT